jgi:hypothetical protein
MEVGLDGRVEKVELHQKQQSFEIAAGTEPASVVLDPGTWMLMNTHFARSK